MDNLTIIFLTRNEHPEYFTEYHKKILLEAVGYHPIITVSRQPLDIGLNIIDTAKESHFNMYRQLLRASKLATTEYVATAESDVLYPKEHFDSYRPSNKNIVAYDMSRWSLFTWNPIFNLKRRISNSTLIAPREYLIEALEERYGDHVDESKVDPGWIGEVGRNNYERALGITLRNKEEFWCKLPSIQINHPNGTNFHDMNQGKRKKMGEIQALEIPYWGRAEDIVKQYK